MSAFEVPQPASLPLERNPENREDFDRDSLRVASLIIGFQQSEITRLRERLITDQKTGVKNESGIREFVEERRTKAEGESGLVVMYLDANHFKDINDRLGHAGGDFVIQETANYLQSIVRPGDVVSRLHGDEFMVMFADTSAVDIMQKFEKQKLIFEVEYRGEKISVSLSAGITEYIPGEAIEETMQRADQAMYLSKEKRDGSVVMAE